MSKIRRNKQKNMRIGLQQKAFHWGIESRPEEVTMPMKEEQSHFEEEGAGQW